MRLLIVSHTPHYQRGDEVVGWGPTLREIEYLAGLFDQVVHIAPLHPEPAPQSSLPYSAKNIRFHPVSPAGGDTILEKASVLIHIPKYVAAIHQEMQNADLVHVRCPAAISLAALFVLMFPLSPKYRWVKFAGNWKPEKRSPFSYALQRWLLTNNFHRGVVTVNGRWKDQPAHVFTFVNPCLTAKEIQIASMEVQKKELAPPYQLIFVGRLESAKGVGNVLKIAAALNQKSVDFQLHLIGDGPECAFFESQAAALGIADRTLFHGWLPRTAINAYFLKAHFILLPSASEGWPKALSEAMAYGAVVLASDVSSIPQILQETGAGIALDADNIEAYTTAILNFIQQPEQWKQFSQNGVQSSSLFTYDQYLVNLKNMAQTAWKISLDQVPCDKN